MLQHEYVRDRLTAALLSYEKTSCNQIVAMASKSQSGCKFQDKPVREIMLDDTSVVIEAEPVRCGNSRSYKTSTLPVSHDLFKYESWRLAILLLAPHYRAWINYCYGDPTNYKNQVLLTEHIWRAFQTLQKAEGCKVMSQKTSQRVQSLIYLSLQESRGIAIRGVAKYKPGQLATLAGVSHYNWTTNYQARWEMMLNICNQLDREAIISAEQLQKRTRANRK